MSNGWVLALATLSCCSAQSWNPEEELPHLEAKTSGLKQMLALICPGNEYFENGAPRGWLRQVWR